MKLKKTLYFLLVVVCLLILQACNGAGQVGPPGPPGVDGLPGDPGVCAVDQCYGGESAFTREVDVAIYCDGAIMNADAIKDIDAAIKGDIFSCQFKIDNGGRVNEPCDAYYCVPLSDGQPSGYAEWFDGVGRYLGGVGSHGRTVDGVAEWKRPPDTNLRGVRIELPGYDTFSEDQLMGGAQYIGKRFPWTANTDDHWSITIVIP